MVGGRRQAFEHVSEVGVRIDALAVAVGDEGVKDGGKRPKIIPSVSVALGGRSAAGYATSSAAAMVRRSAAMRAGVSAGGLFRGGVVREAFDDFDEVVLGVEVLGAAVDQKGVDEGVVRPGFEATKEHPVFMPSLVGRIMFSKRLVSISRTP